MDRGAVYAATAAQRRAVADLIDGLDDAQLAMPSLCAGWDVKTVAAHLVSNLTDGPRAITLLGVRHFGYDRAIDVLARRRAALSVAELSRQLRELANRKYFSWPPRADRGPLADVLVHRGDIELALGMPFEPDPQLVAEALDRLTLSTPTFLIPPTRLRGIRLHATDIDRSWRDGTELSGPAAALMMTVCGRTALRDQVTGPGLWVLTKRLGG